MTEPLVDERFDVVVVGTGLSESIAAAAAARAGKTVLHLDRNRFYGGAQATFTLNELTDFVQSVNNDAAAAPNDLAADGELLTVQVNNDTAQLKRNYDGFALRTFAAAAAAAAVAPETPETVAPDGDGNNEPVPVQARRDLMDEWRRFSLDLAPKLLYSRGEMVSTLISSNVARYLEFRLLERIFVMLDDRAWQRVPCSREDVFGSNMVSLIEKRVLMRFLQLCIDYNEHRDEYADFADRPFSEFLASKQLTPRLQAVVVHAIALSLDAHVTTEQGLAAVKAHLTSLGRYGDTAFLLCGYGAGELPQAFCRVSAIFGGIYMLDSGPKAVHFSKVRADADATAPTPLRFAGVTIQSGQRVTAEHLVTSTEYLRPEDLMSGDADGRAPSDGAAQTDRTVFRMLVVAEVGAAASVLPEVALGLGVVVPGSVGNAGAVSILQLNEQVHACPPGAVVLHLASTTSAADLDLVLAALVHVPDAADGDPAKPRARLVLSYRQHVRTPSRTPLLASNVLLCPAPGDAWDVSDEVVAARNWFSTAFPDTEFLAPSGDEPMI